MLLIKRQLRMKITFPCDWLSQPLQSLKVSALWSALSFHTCHVWFCKCKVRVFSPNTSLNTRKNVLSICLIWPATEGKQKCPEPSLITVKILNISNPKDYIPSTRYRKTLLHKRTPNPHRYLLLTDGFAFFSSKLEFDFCDRTAFFPARNAYHGTKPIR